VIDSHCHLSSSAFDEDRDAALDRALEAGVAQVLDIGCWPDAAARDRSVELAERRPEVSSALAVHPHDVARMAPDSLDHVRDRCAHPRVVAVGETGLDYHYDRSPPDEQRRWFRRFLELAGELSLPCIVHSRSADEDTVRILREVDAGALRGVVHCFTGGPALADVVLELGWSLGITGIVTYKNAEDVVDAARRAPLDRLLVETDAPYLAPVPRRGRRNEPAYVAHTVARLAELRELGADEVARATADNARRLFGLPAPDRT